MRECMGTAGQPRAVPPLCSVLLCLVQCESLNVPSTMRRDRAASHSIAHASALPYISGRSLGVDDLIADLLRALGAAS